MASTGERSSHAAPGPLAVVATVLGLSAFVVAQPLLAVLGDGATFFVAHGATPADVWGFTLLVLVGPAVVVGAVLLVAWGLAPSRWPAALAVVVGVLVAGFVVPAVDRAVGLPVPVYVVLVLVVAAGAARLYERAPAARTYAAATGFAPLLFGGLFLFASPASSLLDPSGSAGGATAGRDTDVVVLVFDEMALAPLLDADGGIDAARFPNLARLAGVSTWYPQATTVAPLTSQAVPSLLSGVVPPGEDTIPVAAEYPRNLLSMLAPTHDVRAVEAITYLCDDECESTRVRSRRLLVRDASTVYLHALLPDGLARRWLPEIGTNWAGFGEDDAPAIDSSTWAEDAAVGAGLDQGPAIEQVLEHLRTPSDRPRLVVGHLLLPHAPMRFLPDGRHYQARVHSEGLLADGTWTDDPAVVAVHRQQYVLQVQYVDRIVGEALDAIESGGGLDDTMVVVTSDHGASFTPGEHRRGRMLTAATVAEITPVPLLVHYPGQAEGTVDRAPRELIDVVPTIAEVLEVELDDAWRFDGVSLLDPDPRSSRTYVGPTEVEVPLRHDLDAAASAYLDVLGSGGSEHDVYAWGPHRDLVGRPVDDVPRSDPVPGASATLTPDLLSRVPATDPSFVPALVALDLQGALAADWVAVSLDGTIAGLGPVVTTDGVGATRVMVDPALIGPENEVGVWAVVDGRIAPLPLG